jgi:predicted NBD/HSP70 family sugar kinase
MAQSDGQRVADRRSVRRHNLSLVLRHLRDAGPRSRARIAAHTGLNKATVSSLVGELAERRLVADGRSERGAIGRPGQAVNLDGASVSGVGAEINVDYVAVAVLDLVGRVVTERRLGMDTVQLGPGPVMDGLATLVRETLDAPDVHGRTVVGLTLAVPGLVRIADGRLVEAPNLGWRDVSVGSLLQERLGPLDCAIRVDNEANLAAMAEYAERRGTVRHLVLLAGTVGVGAGIVVDGRVLRGADGFGGEVGHLPLDKPGALCGCGRRGCWETRVGLGALLQGIADIADSVLDPTLDVEQRLGEVVRRAEAGDRRTLDALDQVGTWLGRGAATIANVVNPELIALGGYVAAIAPWVVEPMRREFAAGVIADPDRCAIEVSPLAFAGAVRGAAEQALDAVFADPTMAPRPMIATEPAGEPA